MNPSDFVIRACRRIAPVLGLFFSGLTFLAAHALIFPVDCLFLLYDLLAVNCRKLEVFGGDCRDVQERCASPLKYTNTWLFRLFVCPGARRHEQIVHFRCEDIARRPQPVRAALGLFFILLLLGAGFSPLMLPGGSDSDGEGDSQPTPEVIAAYSRQAEEAFARQDYSNALENYQKLLRLQPRHKEALYRAGRCLEEEGELRRARLHYRWAMSGADGVAEAPVRLAVGAYREGAVALAGSLAEKALQMGSEAAVAHAIAGEFCLMRGKPGEAAGHLDRAIELHPEDPIVRSARVKGLLENGNVEEAAALLSGAEDTISLPTRRLCEAELLWRQGQPGAASEKLEEFLLDHPEWHGVRVMNARILLATGRAGEALERIDRMVEELHLPPAYLLQLAFMLDGHGHTDRALELAAELTADRSVGARAHLLSAELYLERNLPSLAARHCEAVLEARPDSKKALLLAGRARLARGEPESAGDFLDRALQVAPEDGGVHYLLGRAALASDRIERAVAELEEACRLAPQDGEHHFFYGRALLAAGHRDEAEAAFRKAARRMENPSSACTHLGWLARQRGETERALSWYREAISANPSGAVVAYHNMAELLVSEERYVPLALAMAHTAQAVSSPQERAQTAGTLADALVRAGYGRMALPAARIAAHLAPGHDRRLITLGLAEAAAGNSEQARTALEQARELTAKKEGRKRIQDIIRSLGAGSSEAPPMSGENNQ